MRHDGREMLPAGPRKPDGCGEEGHFIATVKKRIASDNYLKCRKSRDPLDRSQR
jgi:hypothetical protein